jgi:hypothetical protein
METKAPTADASLPLVEKVDQLTEQLEQWPGWIVEQAPRLSRTAEDALAPEAGGAGRCARRPHH